MNSIPKIIHYCWFGKNKKSKLINKCIESWKKNCPDYKIIEWNEENFDINMNTYSKEAYENKKWAFVADYARLWVVYNFGGIYLDTDVELISSLDSVLNDEVFFCLENEKSIATGLGFGAIKNNKIVKKIMDDYNEIHFINNNKMDLTPCPIRNTESIKEIFGKYSNKKDKALINNVRFYPKEYFCPLNTATGILNITDKTIAIHWYNGSWISNRKFKKIITKYTRLIKRIIGVEKYNNLKRKLIKRSN